MIGKQGKQLYHQETKGDKTPHLRKTQSKQKVVHHGTYNYIPARKGRGGGTSAN